MFTANGEPTGWTPGLASAIVTLVTLFGRQLVSHGLITIALARLSEQFVSLFVTPTEIPFGIHWLPHPPAPGVHWIDGAVRPAVS